MVEAVVPAQYAGKLGALIYRTPEADGQRVDLFLCGVDGVVPVSEVLLRAVRLLPQHIVDLSFPRACEGLNDHGIMSDTFEEASRTRKRQPREEPHERLA